MKVDIYTICWNEADMLGFFFRHYDEIADRYIIFDDGSTDGSLEILERHPKVILRPFPDRIENSYVLTAKHLHNSVWKESRGQADWAILTAIDEHLAHYNLKNYLERCLERGVTFIPAVGYQMISDTFPDPNEVLVRAISSGAPFDAMSKLCVLKPDAIQETNFEIGRHSASPTGVLCIPERDELLNLHFKYLDFERLFSRHHVLASGLGETDLKNQWGHRYLYERERLRMDWMAFKNQSFDLAQALPDAIEAHGGHRWWRTDLANINMVQP